MKINNKILMRSLPMVAAVLGKKYGVQVEVGGKEAYTDGNVIHIPSLDLEKQSNLMSLIRGFIDHESAHIRHTKFDVLKNSNLSDLTKHVFNIIEDWRVENALVKSFPGCRQNFDWLINHHFAEPVKIERKPEEIVNYILYSVRSWDVKTVESNRDAVANVIEKMFPGLVHQLNLVLGCAKKGCDSTFSAIYFAERIVEMIKLHSEQNPEKQSKNKAVGDYTEASKNAQKSDQNSPYSAKKLQQLLQSSSNSLPKGLGELCAEELSCEFQQHGSYSNTVAVVGKKDLTAFNASELDNIKRSSIALETRLQSLLQASVMKRKLPARRGRINPNRLYRLQSDPKLFLRNQECVGISTAIHVLLDCSGSMRRRINLASQACYSMAHSLSKINGVSVAVTAFPAESGDNKAAIVGSCSAVFPILKHGERLHSNFKVKATGTTPMAETLWWTMQQDMNLNENRKIIFIITDGKPDYEENTKNAIEQGGELGFEFYGIGINEPYIEKLLPGHATVINKLSELTPALFDVLQSAIIK